MTSIPDYRAKALTRTIKGLKEDLVDDEKGPRISTMRSYRYAIVTYQPDDEWELRAQIRELSDELTTIGWVVHSISLHRLMLQRLQREYGEEILQRFIEMEKKLSQRAPDRAMKFLKSKLIQAIEGPDGLARDISDEIHELVDRDPERADQMVVFLGHTGALYPFMRTSALLKHLDGHTRNVPVILLYPGATDSDNGLSFMGQLEPHQDYRPRIYSAETYKL